MGRGKAFDPNRWFIFCANVLGSPYGTVSPITQNPNTNKPYGPEFPPTTIRDDVRYVLPIPSPFPSHRTLSHVIFHNPPKRLHKLVLDNLGVRSVAVVIGGSMGGMAVLEWPLCTPAGYVRYLVPLATSARHSAWCISWGEAQRQSIYSDPDYKDGYYDKQPAVGLAAARMSALLTYRSRDSFEKRFGRRPQVKRVVAHGRTTTISADHASGVLTPPASPPATTSAADEAFAVHNEGHRNATLRRSSPPPPSPPLTTIKSTATIFSAQSYLRYQGDKFTSRFDANCYIHITRKLDTHDLTRGRVHLYFNKQLGTVAGESPSATRNAFLKTAALAFPPDILAPYLPTPISSPCLPTPSFFLSPPSQELDNQVDQDTLLSHILSLIPPRALIVSIASDGLFTTTEQQELAAHIPDAELVVIESVDGHDGFLLEFEAINRHIVRVLRREFPERFVGDTDDVNEGEAGFEIQKTSVFGEAEVDIANW